MRTRTECKISFSCFGLASHHSLCTLSSYSLLWRNMSDTWLSSSFSMQLTVCIPSPPHPVAPFLSLIQFLIHNIVICMFSIRKTSTTPCCLSSPIAKTNKYSCTVSKQLRSCTFSSSSVLDVVQYLVMFWYKCKLARHTSHALTNSLLRIPFLFSLWV